MKNTNKFIDLINKLSLDLNNLPLYEIENTICNELERFKNYIINLNERKTLNMYTNVINSNQIINKKNNIDNNINNSTKVNYRKIKTLPEFHSNFNYIDNNNLYNINSNIAYDINNYYNNNQNNEFQNNQYITKITLKYFAQTQGNYNIFGRQFIENNEKNIDLIINGKRSHLIDNCILNNGENTITLLIKNKLINLSYMFSWCNSLSNIEELKYLDVKYSNDFSYMFCGCSSLSDISPLKHWNVSSGKNFSSMFCNCTALSNLNPIKNWNVSNGNNFQYMFYGCSSLTDLHPLQNWNVSNRGEFEKMFSGCSLILDAEPIPNWSISKEKYDSLI
jgi:surface protein